MAVWTLVQIILILLVLAVGVINLYYTHFSNPESDIVFQSNVSSSLMGEGRGGQSRAKYLEGEFDYWLYYTANNRGDDNGHVMSATLRKLEFFDADNPGEGTTLQRDDLEGSVYGAAPLTILQREVGETFERGAILVPAGGVTEILVVLRIFSSEVPQAAKRFDQTRALIEFEMIDPEHSYKRSKWSEPVRAGSLVPRETR